MAALQFTQFYSMSKNPFAKGIAPSDACQTEGLREACARLDHLRAVGGIGLLTAEPGVGKTFAVRAWASRLNPNTTKLVYTCMSTVTNNEFYRQLAQGFGLTPGFKKCDLFRDVQACVRNLADERRVRVALVVDEAQYLHSSILRDLQMITNFDMDSRDLLSLVLVGHPVLAQYLSRQPYESLRQRLVVSYRMPGLDAAQVAAYVREMLGRAGADPDLFDDAALAGAASMCGGSIRRLNSIVCNALTIGAQERSAHVDAEMVRSAAAELSLA